MAATDLNDLHEFEYHFETAAVTFLNAATGISCYRTTIENNIVTPRIEVEFQPQMAIDPPILHGGGANPSDIDYAAYKAVFMCRVVTDNTLAGSADDHVAFLAKCRTSLLRSGTNWNSSNLPYYDLKYIRNVGMNKSVDGDLNISQLDFDITFEIRNDAWPS